LDWTLHIADAHLAHIVFVTSNSLAQLDLDSHSIYRNRRSLIWINYPSPNKTKDYILKEFESQPDLVPNPSNIEWIINCIGSHLEDMDLVISAIKRGEAIYNILRRMITDSITVVEEQIEEIIKEAKNSREENKIAVFGKYLRFWKMMTILRDEEYVRRKDIVVTVFNEHVKELEGYIKIDLLSYVNRGKQELSTDSTSKSQSEAIVSEKSDDEQVIRFMYSENLDSIFVSSGSTRIRIAFDRLLSDEKYITQRKWVENYVALKKLDHKRIRSEKILVSLLEEKTFITSEISNLIVNAAKWKDEIGAEGFEVRRNRLISEESGMEAAVERVRNRLTKYSNEILNIKQTQRQLKTGMNEHTQYLSAFDK